MQLWSSVSWMIGEQTLVGHLVFFRSESRGVFSRCLGCLVLSAARFAPGSCCCSHVHGRSPMETMRWHVDASCSRSAAPRCRLVGRVLLPAARAAQPSEHISQLSWHMSFSQSSARAQHCHPSLQLNVESGFRHIFEHTSACGNRVIFSPVPRKDLAVAQHFRDRCA